MNWLFDLIYWLLHPKKKREALALLAARRKERRYWDEQLVREVGPLMGMPITNIRNWPDERVRWSVEHILHLCEEGRK